MAFNPKGNLLAAGTQKGSLLIFDFETRGLERNCGCLHPDQAVTSVSFTGDGSRVLTATGFAHESKAPNAVLYDLAEAKVAVEVVLPSPPTFARVHPNGAEFLACFHQGPPVIYSISSAPSSRQVQASVCLPKDKEGSSHPPAWPVTANYLGDGDRVALGNASGEVEIVRNDLAFSVAMRRTAPIADSGAIKAIVENQARTLIALNIAGRSQQGFVRILQLVGGEGEGDRGAECASNVVGDFHDPACFAKGSSLGWVAFSWDNGHLLATSGAESKHHLSVWNLETQKLSCVLESSGLQPVWHAAWRPNRAALVTVNADGNCSVFGKKEKENWSCFAPGFRELEKNEEYVEQEDEFDASPAEQRTPAPPHSRDLVNILT